MTSYALTRVLNLTAASYKWASVLGFLAAGFLFPLAAALRPDADARILLPGLAIFGPVAGCVLTFVSRRLLHLLVDGGTFEHHGASEIDDDGRSIQIKAAIAISAFLVAGAMVLFLAMSGAGEATSLPRKCMATIKC